MASKKIDRPDNNHTEIASRPKCGLIMPISSIGDYPESHWSDVQEIITDAVADAGLEASLVSYADETTVIPKTIVQNLYDNPIVICDVSSKNPNVMFELGLRLAFDKPTIIVKDNATSFSFDTGTIEHLPYPRDLRFARIVEFKAKLTSKIAGTLEAAKDPDYSTFLKHFGKFTVAKLQETEVSGQEYVIEELRSIRETLNTLSRQDSRVPKNVNSVTSIGLKVSDLDSNEREVLKNAIERISGATFNGYGDSDDGTYMVVTVETEAAEKKAFDLRRTLFKKSYI
jgi:hypothetical protein